MKKFFKPFVLIVAALAAVVACNKETEIVTPEENGEGIVLNFVSEKPDLIDADTRTVFNPETGSIEWSAGDKIKVGITVDDTWMAAAGAPGEGEKAKLYTSNGLAAGGASGVFSVPLSFTVELAGTYKFYGLYPDSVVSGADAQYAPSITFSIPSTQIPAAASFDDAADVMIAVSEEYEGIPADRNIDLVWTRLVAHGDITLKKLPAFASDETIQGLTISAQSGADLVGTHYVNLTTGAVTLPTNATPVNEIAIDTRNLTVNTEDNTLEFWFSSLPFTASSLKVVITTNKKVYTKEYTGLNLEFLANRRNTLGIGMKNATEVDKTQLIANGEYVISYDLSGQMMAVGNESDSFRESVALNTTNPTDDAVWTITYEADQDAYKIYNADVAKYLFGHTGDETYLELHESTWTSSKYTNLFKIVESSTSEGAYVFTPLGNTVRKVGYNTKQPRFALYKGTTDQHADLNLHSVSFDTTPRIVVPSEPVSIAKNAITEARTIATITRKYFDGAISAESDVDWLSVNDLAEGETEVKVTVEANTGASRTAVITLSARDIESKEITVVQATGASNVTDVIDLALTGVTGTGYVSWSGKTSNSAAVYAGQSAGGNSSIQMRSSNSNSGIITTTSGGAVKSIVVTWNSNTSSGQTVDIYGKNTAYTAPTDLYSSSTQGTKIGSIVCGTSTELIVSDEYEYMGIRSKSGAVYIDKIEITWGDAKLEAPLSWSANEATATLTSTDPETGVSFTAPTLSNNANLTVTYESSNTTVATVTATGVVSPLAGGETQIKAVFAGNDSYKPKTVAYTLTVVDNIPVVATPTFSPAPGQVEEGTLVTIFCGTEGATIYYTLDGSTPTTSSTQGNSVVINAAVTIKAIAVKAGCRNSAVATASYSLSSGGTAGSATYDFSKISGFDSWGTSYSKRTVEYTEATVVFASANHQLNTITDIPVTKGGDVELVLNEGVLNSVQFDCRQWGTKAKTITLHYSTDSGETYTSTGTTSSNFTINSNSLPSGTNAVKISFSESNNQVGIEGVSFTYTK